MWVYVFFNIAAAVLLYYFVRVYPQKKNSKTSKGKKGKKTEAAPQKTEQDGRGEMEKTKEQSEGGTSDEEEDLHRTYSMLPAAVQPFAENWRSRQLQRTATNQRNAYVY